RKRDCNEAWVGHWSASYLAGTTASGGAAQVDTRSVGSTTRSARRFKGGGPLGPGQAVEGGSRTPLRERRVRLRCLGLHARAVALGCLVSRVGLARPVCAVARHDDHTLRLARAHDE